MYEEELRFFMKRRSIRSFQDRPVEEEKVEFLLKAAATAATAIHLGSLWIGVYGVEPFVEKVMKVMGLPEHVKPLGIAYVGYANEEKEPRTQYDEKRVYRDVYDMERKHRTRPKNMKHL